MSGNGTIGATALYLLFSWLISAAAAAWLADSKGYGERVGLMFGLILSVLGLLIVVFALPGLHGSRWGKGWLPDVVKRAFGIVPTQGTGGQQDLP